MEKRLSFFLFILVLWVGQKETDVVTLNPVKIPETEEAGSCPPPQMRSAVIQNISASVRNFIAELYDPNCGSGPWHRVANLNMSDPSQQCPSAWREDNTNGIRSCRRPQTTDGSCPGTSYNTGRQYSKVCGRATGYQIGSSDAFGHLAIGQDLNANYVYGVSVTHGVPRNHIWTFAAGLSEGDHSNTRVNCPCSDPSNPSSQFPPSFVGNNWYCESGNPSSTYVDGHIYSNDPLWDGQQCEGQCCSNGKTPPWFTVQLLNPTTDDIEVRICSAQGSIDETALQLVAIYVQ